MKKVKIGANLKVTINKDTSWNLVDGYFVGVECHLLSKG